MDFELAGGRGSVVVLEGGFSGGGMVVVVAVVKVVLGRLGRGEVGFEGGE